METQRYIATKIVLLGAVLCCSSCLDQYKPFAFWQQLEAERLAAEHGHEVRGADGKLKILNAQGELEIVEPEADPSESGDPLVALFTRACAACHGADGGGNAALKARAFTDPTWQNQASDEQIKVVLQLGTAALLAGQSPEIFAEIKARPSYAEHPFTGAMPAGGAAGRALTDAEIEGLVAMIRGFAP